MLKWFSGEEGGPGSGAPGSPQEAAGGGETALTEVMERLAQNEQLVAQLKEMIREKDAALRTKDDLLKVEKEACETKLSKLRLQNKAKVTSLTAQLEELKKQQGGQDTPTHSKKGAADGEHASRGKIVLLKKKVEELEQQLAQREVELENKRKEVEAQRKRGEEMDTMLTERDRKLAEKEAYIVHLQTGLAGDQPITPAPQQQATEESGALQELQLLVQSLTKKVGEAEERYSLLKEQTDSLKELLATEKDQYNQKENMYKQNIQTFKDIILQKDNQLIEVNQMHEQELFKLAAKSDASADLEQLLKALKQKLHEKEEVLLGKTQVIDVLQGEVDGRDQQIKELMERVRRLQVERESLESKLEAEKHVMRAQLRDLMEKQQVEVKRMTEQHQAQMAQTQQDLLGQLEELRRASVAAPPANQQASGSGNVPTDSASVQRLAELEAQAKQKMEEAGKSEAKFLKMKAWSKCRIRQLEEELKKSQAGGAPPDLAALRSRIMELEEEREESLWKLEQYEELKAKNDVLEAKLVVYEEQQRTLQADLEQVTKRAASQASESGSADDTQSQVLEWQEMVAEAVSARDRAREEKAAMVLRISHMEEEREGLIEDDWFFPGCSDPALASRQQELEEELSQARGLSQHRAKKLAAPSQRSLQEDFEFDGQTRFQDPRSASESTTPMEGENMGGWWPEYSTPDTDGLRSVVEELELERNQLQEQILGLEERCHDLEDRLQLQARIEALQVTFDVDEDGRPYWVSQNESERLQSQLASVRSQQSRDAEKHQLLVTSLNEQLKGLSDTQECLESSLIEKENTLAKTSEKLELINSLRESLSEKEIQYKDVSDKLLQTEHTLMDVSKKCSSSEKQCSELKTEVVDLTQKLTVLKEKTQKQEVAIETLQTELDQTNEELDKLNTTHLEERAQLIHDLQSCEREIDSLKDILLDKEKEISTLSGNMVEYAEQITMLKQEIKLKEEDLVRTESALSKAEREAMIIRDSQDSDQQGLNNKIADLVEKLKDTETELIKAKEERESKLAEVEDLTKQADEDKKTIQDLRGEIQKQTVSHRNHLSECETQISSLKEQITLSTHKLQQESEGLILQLKDKNTSNEKLQQQLHDKEQTYEKELKSFKEEQNKLLAEVAKYKDDMQTLSKQLEEQVQSQEHIKKAMQEKFETIASLEDQLKAIHKQAEGEKQKLSTELQVRDSEKDKLGKELESKSENISKLKNLLKSTKSEKQKLQGKLKGLNEEFESQKQHVEQLNEKVSKVNSLTKENERLELEVTESMKSISELTVERESLLAKISTFETQHLENGKIIEGLQKEKEDLSVQINELNRVLEQSTQSNSETLLEKINECSHLNQLLREKEEKVAQLQEQVQSMISQVEQFQHNMQEKEQTVTDLKTEMETQQSQKMQLQETLSLLQEQECTLKSELMEKDAMLKQKQEEYHSLQNEITEQKSITSKQQAEAESLHGECLQLRQQIKEREEMFKNVTQQCQKHNDELNDKNKTVLSLSSQLSVIEDNTIKLESEKAELKTSLENYGTENAKMKQELEQRQTEMVGLHSHIQAVTEQNHHLRAAYEIREKELAQQIQVASDLDGRVKVSLEQISNFSMKINSLTEDNQRLQEELAQKVESVSELTAERSLLQEKLSGLEIQHSENRKIIDSLMKDKEELTMTTDDLNKVLKQNEQSNSASLLEKTTECTNLSKTLRETEDQVAGLQEQVDSLKTQVNQLNTSMNEKEKTLSEQCSHMEAQQAQLVQLQDTLSLLQEQGSVLKSGLMEKDTMFQQKTEECSVYQNEVMLHKELVSKMQGETESLREECLKLQQQIERKEQTLRDITNEFQNHKDELNKRNESVMSLSSQLGAMNENAAEMEVEITNLKATVEKLCAENSQQMQEEDQRKAEVLDLRDNIQALNEQNTRLKSELQKSVMEQSKAIEEITNLRTAVCDRDNQVSNLTEELNAACSEKERLSLTVQEKDVSQKQQEKFIQQLQAKSLEVDGQTSQQTEVITQLQSKAQTLEQCLQDKDVLLQQTEKELSFLQEKFTSETESSKSQLDSIAELHRELNNAVEKTKELNSRIAEQEVQLKQKVDDNVSLATQVSELGDSVFKLRGQVDTLTSESSILKETLKEKELLSLESQSTSSAAIGNLNSKLEAKEAECESMKEQLSHLQESVTKLHTTLQVQTSEIAALKKALEEKEAALLDQSNSLQDMQRRADEAVLFKTQFMESAELISQLQSQIQSLSTESANLSKSVEEKQKNVLLLEKKILEKEEDILKLEREKERLVEQLQTDKQILQATLNEKEVCLSETLHTLNEKSSLIKQLQSSISEQEDAFERDRHGMMQKLEELQNEMKKTEDDLKDKSGSIATAVDLENELAQLKQEKAMLQKKTQAALLARRETLKKSQENEKKLVQELAEMKDDYKALLEQHCQQTNELNAVQLKFDEKVKELEDVRKASLSHLDELETLRQLVEERDKTLQNLKMSLAEKESQGHTLPILQTDLETAQSKLESLSSEMASKDEAFIALEQRSQALNSKLCMVENDLAKAHAKIKEKTEEFEKCQNAIKVAELKSQQEKQTLTDENLVLQSQLSVSQAAVEELKCKVDAYICENEQKYQILMGEKKALLEQRDLMKVELETALASVSLKSSELQTIQNTLAETQQQLNEDKDCLAKELEIAQLHCTPNESNKLHMELLQQEKENAFRFVDQLRDEVATLNTQLKEAEEINEQLRQKIHVMHEKYVKQEDVNKEEVQSLSKYTENCEAKLKARDDALLISQAQVSEKEELIAALEQQLQRQIHLHEIAMEKMRIEAGELQKSREDGTKMNDQDNPNKTALITRKLQAALISRKELLKDNTTLKEQLEALSAKHEEKEAYSVALELSVSKLKRQNVDLESFASSLSKERDKLITEVDGILNDNHNLSAACESLKLTIENITQQKQAFSCQLESLKDSQTEELSEWKSKHSELKQEYESLLQAYENVSSEMDKMRQLLEGAKRERQEALRKVHKHETERESLEKQAREMEEENVRIKEKMRKFSKVKQQKIEELEEENQKIRRELIEFDEKQKITVDELTVKNQQLEAEICNLQESSEELGEKLAAIQAENSKLAEELKEASCSLEKRHLQSKSCVNNMQFKLDEALGLNNSLTAQIEAQKTELGAQLEINDLLQREKQNLSARTEQIQNDHELQLGEKDNVIKELKDIINKHSQETISLNEKVRILEDDKSLLQEELENVQETSDKVKNENEYLETVILQNSERIDELTESVGALQTQNMQLSSQVAANKEMTTQVCQEKEEEQLRLVKEFEEKLKMVRRGNEGSKNVKKELQELLKEKHHEINQLQQNCIKYQELILDLERSWKTSQSACEELEMELKKSLEKISILDERGKQLEAELIMHKNLLQEATESIVSIRSEKDQLALEISEKSKNWEHQVIERTTVPENLDEQQKNVYMEKQIILQKQIDDLQSLNEQESQIVIELRQQIDSQDLQINTLKREAETNATKLSALSSTLQGADATKQWNDLYQKTLHEKDSQLLEQGFVIRRFLEDMRVKDNEVNELRVTKSRLERTLNEYSVAAAAQQRQLFVMGASNTELAETVELMTVQLKELRAQIERIEQDKSTLNRELADEEDVTSQMQLQVQQLEKMNADTDAQLLLLQTQNDKLQSDFEKQEAISLQLKKLLHSKDAEISSLLSSRDGQMSGYLEQLQTNYRAQAAGYEDRLTSLHYQKEKADKDLRGLETKVKSLQIKADRSIQEKEQMAAKMESFRNSMVSLQSERERLMSEYRMLEARNQLGLKGREGSEGEVNATKGLKHEIRKLLHQMDDLNSENAMLRAQLVRYREDLNQVLSLKDNQLKVLLKKQQDMIKNLENQKAAAEKQNRESLLELQKEEEASNTLKAETSKLKTQVAKLEADILALKKERAMMNEGKVIADLQQAVAAKAAECNDLQQKHFAQKVLTDELTNKLQLLESETDKKLAEAEDKYNSELDTFEREVELMRNERETADQRVAELAKDLLQTEQLLSEAKAQSKDIKAQNESLGKAMAALQNDRDQLIEDFKILQNRYDEELRETQAALTKVEHSLQDATTELAVFAKERHVLVQKMKALESKDTQTELNKLLDELTKALSEKERELKQVILENNTYSRQVSAFSRSMASLQNDRDRLMDELAGAKRVVESRQGSGPEAVTSVSVEESNGSGVNAFQNERDGLEMRQKVDELQKTLQKAQAYKLQTEKEVSSYQTEIADLRSERNSLHSECQALKEKQQAAERKDGQPVKETVALVGQSGMEEMVRQLETERIQLHRDLQRCLYEIQQRDQYYQQLNTKLQQTAEEKGAVAAQLRAVSQTLRDTQNRCHWLESQVQGQAQQGSVCAEVAPGAPQERSSHSITIETAEATLQERLLEVEQSLAEERGRREAAEEALCLAEDRAKSVGSSPSPSRSSQRDFSIQLEAEEEWEALILDPNQPLLTRKVKGGALACRRWLRGRSLYCSKLLTTRARSRYFFLAYLLTLHVVVLMCLTGAL
ncbi:golgin subfamily B member 1 isoform X3 [Centroberyx affinis]|uniref:golgin subfamily B member 1 isoform X3 n=1 Tax=Centroberyx affinis TaxID=166261 RepID=UPI003A5C0C40